MDDPKARESELPQREAKRSKAFLRWIVLLLFIFNAGIIFKVFARKYSVALLINGKADRGN